MFIDPPRASERAWGGGASLRYGSGRERSAFLTIMRNC
jgi:hypothetical protein